MARLPRAFAEGVALHVVQRGNNRNACFADAADRMVYLAMLGDLCGKTGCAIHAYVLMTNHVHLLLTPIRAIGASWMMKHLGQRYVQFVNRTRSRTGSLWEGRFRSSIVDSSTYLLTCYRYIELNPVRAGMVRQPGEYPWSSYRVNANGDPSDLIQPHERYLRLAEDDAARRAAYRGLFGRPLGLDAIKTIREAANGGFALGSPAFLASLSSTAGRRASRGVPGRPPKIARETTSHLEEKRGLSPVLF